MMKCTWPLPPRVGHTPSVPLLDSLITELFARVWPVEKLILLVPGTNWSPGKRVRFPAPPAFTTVTFIATASAPTGTPQRPVNVKARRFPEDNAGPPKGPVGSRVSATRQGV